VDAGADQGRVGAAPATLRRLLDQQQVRRVAPTRRQRAAAAAASGPNKQARAVQQRCQARLAELGFAGWRRTCKIGLWGAAGRCGGCALNSGWGMRGSASNSIGSGCASTNR